MVMRTLLVVLAGMTYSSVAVVCQTVTGLLTSRRGVIAAVIWLRTLSMLVDTRRSASDTAAVSVRPGASVSAADCADVLVRKKNRPNSLNPTRPYSAATAWRMVSQESAL